MDARKHTDRQYDEQLRVLRAQLRLMNAHVDAAIERAVKALMSGDTKLAVKTIARDDVLDDFETEIDRLCLVLLATRAPMGSDLQFVTKATKIASELERIGDLAVSICERVLEASDAVVLTADQRIAETAQVVRGMLDDAMAAFLDASAPRARSVLAREHEMNQRFGEVFEDMLALMTKDPSLLRHGIRMQSVAKRLEHMGDHTMSIAAAALETLRE